MAFSKIEEEFRFRPRENSITITSVQGGVILTVSSRGDPRRRREADLRALQDPDPLHQVVHGREVAKDTGGEPEEVLADGRRVQVKTVALITSFMWPRDFKHAPCRSKLSHHIDVPVTDLNLR